MAKNKELTCTCYRADGSLIPVDENGDFDPPLYLPLDIQIEWLQILNPGKRFTVELVDGEEQ